jgi:hypothetical protein
MELHHPAEKPKAIKWFKLFCGAHLVSVEKTEEGYVAPLALAAAMICWCQAIVIYG